MIAGAFMQFADSGHGALGLFPKPGSSKTSMLLLCAGLARGT